MKLWNTEYAIHFEACKFETLNNFFPFISQSKFDTHTKRKISTKTDRFYKMDAMGVELKSENIRLPFVSLPGNHRIGSFPIRNHLHFSILSVLLSNRNYRFRLLITLCSQCSTII